MSLFTEIFGAHWTMPRSRPFLWRMSPPPPLQWNYGPNPYAGIEERHLNEMARDMSRQPRPMVAGDLDASHPFPQSPDGGPYFRAMVEGDL